MNFKLLRFLYSFSFMLLGWCCYASADGSDTQKLPKQLDITPDTCVLTTKKTGCVLDLKVQFPTMLPVAACLWQEQISEPIHCFPANTPLQYQYQVKVEKPTFLQLKDMQETLIAQARIEIAIFEPVIPSRRRRGIGWNLL